MSQRRSCHRLPVPAGFRLAATVLSHGWYEIPPFRWEDREILAIALRDRRGDPLRLEITQPPPGGDLLLRWRPTDRSPGAREARRVASRVLNLGWDLEAFHRLCRHYPPLGWVRRAGAGRILRGPTVFGDLVASICGTNIAWKQAVKAVHRLCEVAPAEPAGGLRCFPTPEELLAAGAPHLREHARIGYRAEYVLELCRMVQSGQLDLEGPLARGVDGRTARELFRRVPGIGPVTARYLGVLYGHFDELAVDSLVLTYIGDKYHGGRKATPEEVQERYRTFGSLRALAYWFEFLGDVDPVTWRGWDTPRNAPDPTNAVPIGRQRTKAAE